MSGIVTVAILYTLTDKVNYWALEKNKRKVKGIIMAKRKTKKQVQTLLQILLQSQYVLFQ